MSHISRTALHKTPYLLQTYKVCGPNLSLRLFIDIFREKQGQLRSLLLLLQRGREEEFPKVVVVTGGCGGRAPERVLLRHVSS
jgi:DNA-nicking Smr family endonuclease